jgi:lipopolysaccharide transport system ATP-binding protein
VLAVGDAEFQKKCLGKMKDVTSQGRTVMFVSHNMSTITSLCDECILLNQGEIQALGPSHKVVDLYFSEGSHGGSTIEYETQHSRPGDNIARLCSAKIVNAKFEIVDAVSRGEPLGVEMVFEVLQSGHRLLPNFHVFLQDQYAFVSSPRRDEPLTAGIYRSVMWIPPRFLNNGLFVVGLALTSMSPVVIHFFEQDALRFHVIDNLFDESRNDYTQEYPGVVRPDLQWDIIQES